MRTKLSVHEADLEVEYKIEEGFPPSEHHPGDQNKLIVEEVYWKGNEVMEFLEELSVLDDVKYLLRNKI